MVQRAPLVVMILAVVISLAASGFAQESSSAAHSNKEGSSPATAISEPRDAPTAALRDALFAACTQTEQSFSKFLTARNADTFAHLTPSARVALMKRFAPQMDVADACLVTLAARDAEAIILTTDTRDFSIYRVPFASPQGLFAEW